MIPDLLTHKRTLLIGEPMSHQFFIAQSLLYASPRARIIWVTRGDQAGIAAVHSFRTAYTSGAALTYIGSQIAETATLVKIIQRTAGDDNTIVVHDSSQEARPLAEGDEWLERQSEIAAALPNVRCLTVASSGPLPASVRPHLNAGHFDAVYHILDGHPKPIGAVLQARYGTLVRLKQEGSDTSYLLRGTSALGTVTFDLEKEPAPLIRPSSERISYV
jgi:hypothetical protein